jgi:hypothetical protein
VVAVSGLRRKRRPAVSHRADDEVTALACLALAIVPSLGFMYLFHYGKGGYILSFLPAAVLLLLWPAVHLVRRNRLGLVSAVVIGGLVVAGSGLAAQRFLFGKGILPQRFTDRGLEITQGHFGAPFRWTRFAIDANDAMTDRLRGLERVADPDKDVIVFTWLNGSQWLRHVMWTMPGYWVEMMVGNTNDLTGRHLVWEKHHQETVLPVPIGGRAFLLYDALPSGVDALVRAGTVTPLQLATGATVWVVRPGTVINGVTVTEVPPQAMTQGRIP